MERSCSDGGMDGWMDARLVSAIYLAYLNNLNSFPSPIHFPTHHITLTLRLATRGTPGRYLST